MAIWENVPVVFITRPSCPACGSTALLRIRSEANGDGSTTRKVVCRECSQRFKVVVEIAPGGRLPRSGKDDDRFW